MNKLLFILFAHIILYPQKIFETPDIYDIITEKN